MTRLLPCLVLLLCCLAACTSRNVPDKAGYTPVAAPWTCATYLDSNENALTPVLMLDGWAAARTQQVRLGKAGTDALLDHLEAWCPTHREDKLADVILAWRRQHADRGRMLPAVSCAGWYAPATAANRDRAPLHESHRRQRADLPDMPMALPPGELARKRLRGLTLLRSPSVPADRYPSACAAFRRRSSRLPHKPG